MPNLSFPALCNFPHAAAPNPSTATAKTTLTNRFILPPRFERIETPFSQQTPYPPAHAPRIDSPLKEKPPGM
jgi:hypothetical protein